VSTLSPLLRIPLPGGADNGFVPDWLNPAIDQIEQRTLMPFADRSERDAYMTMLGTGAQRGMECYLYSPGWYEMYDGSIWRPRSGTPITSGRLTQGATLTLATNEEQTFFSINLPSQPFETTVWVDLSCVGQGNNASSRGDGRIYINGDLGSAGLGYFGSTRTARHRADIPPNTPAAITGTFINLSADPIFIPVDTVLNYMNYLQVSF
jgi:hypothetical protein